MEGRWEWKLSWRRDFFDYEIQMAKELVGLEMEKSKAVCTSEWQSKELTQTQIEYACIDAYASFKIGKMILNQD